MNKDYETQRKYIKDHELSLDDTFHFGCKGCGKCCKHRHDILLSSYDLYRICKYLDRTPAEVLERYCESYVGENSHSLVVRAKPAPPDDACPFQRGKRCSIHPAKPLVCATYPLGRAVYSTREKPIYFLRPEITCGNMDKTTTVRNWIGGFADEEAERAGIMCGEARGLIATACSESWNILNAAAKKRLVQSQLDLFYLSYDIELPFIPQFESNTAKLILTALKDDVDTEIVPLWLPVPDDLKPEEKATLLVRKAYFKYILDWSNSRGFNLEDLDADREEFPDGCRYVCFAEFQGAEYRDESYMKRLLDKREFALWTQIIDTPDLGRPGKD